MGSGRRYLASGITSNFTKLLSSCPRSFAISRPRRATRTASSAVLQPAVFGSIQIFDQSRASANPSWPGALVWTRRTATVTISQPLAATLARISSKFRYLPVPVISRDLNGRSPMVNTSSALSARAVWTARVGKGDCRVCMDSSGLSVEGWTGLSSVPDLCLIKGHPLKGLDGKGISGRDIWRG